jgi:flavin reductase (DIM6/NTAB) family NADH-FMN oxidoreductase RutF
VHEAGDHLLVLGLVEEFAYQAGDALVFHQGAFKKIR